MFLRIDEAVFNITGWAFYEWNTVNVGDGAHVVDIIATDKAGNLGKAQITVVTKNVQGATERNYASDRDLGLIVGVPVGLFVSAH